MKMLSVLLQSIILLSGALAAAEIPAPCQPGSAEIYFNAEPVVISHSGTSCRVKLEISPNSTPNQYCPLQIEDLKNREFVVPDCAIDARYAGGLMIRNGDHFSVDGKPL